MILNTYILRKLHEIFILYLLQHMFLRNLNNQKVVIRYYYGFRDKPCTIRYIISRY